MTRTEWIGMQEACRALIPAILLVAALAFAAHIIGGARLRWPTWGELGAGLSWLVVLVMLACYACWRFVGGAE